MIKMVIIMLMMISVVNGGGDDEDGNNVCFVVNNKCIAATNGFKLCSLISVNTHMRSKSIVKIQQS